MNPCVRITCALLVACLAFTERSCAAPPTAEQVNVALDLAEQAASHGLTQFSLQAVRRALKFGPPNVSTTPPPELVFSSARIDTSRPLPPGMTETVRRRIYPLVVSLEKGWQKTAAPTAVYDTLQDIVLPSERPETAFLYIQLGAVDPRHPFRIPDAHSLAELLVRHAQLSGSQPRLVQMLKPQNDQPSLERLVVSILLALELNDEVLLEQLLPLLRASTPANVRPELPRYLAALGAKLLADGRQLVLAAELLQRSAVFMQQVQPQDKATLIATDGILLAAARSQFAVGQDNVGVELLTQLHKGTIADETTSAANDNEQRVQIVCQELYGRGLVEEARQILGRTRAADFERRYQTEELIGNRLPPDVPPNTGVPQSATANTTQNFTVHTREWPPDGLANVIQVMALQYDQQTSETLFTVSGLQSLSSIDVCVRQDRIAFEATFPGDALTSGRQLYSLSFDGSDVLELGPGALPSWSPDGNRLAFSSYSPHRGVWVMRADGSGKQLIDASGWSGQWSPDGRMIAYLSVSGGRFGVNVYDFFEDEFFTVISPQASSVKHISEGLCWSPDSQWIAFHGTPHGSDRAKVYTVNVRPNGQPQPVFSQSWSLSADMAWDGIRRQLIIPGRRFSQSAEQLFGVSLDNVDTIAEIPGQASADDWRNVSLCLPPEGQTLFFVRKTVDTGQSR